MTIILPSYTKHKPLYWFWKFKYRAKKLIHDYKRNPDCNERRRYKDDIKFTYGEHKHFPPIIGTHLKTGERIKFEQVGVPFKPFKFDGPAYDNGLVLSNWNWFK